MGGSCSVGGSWGEVVSCVAGTRRQLGGRQLGQKQLRAKSRDMNMNMAP